MLNNREPAMVLIAFIILAALKLLLLALYGPVSFPDTDGYTIVATHMASNPEWLHSATITGTDPTPSVFRIIGYPALIWAMRSLAGEHWEYALAVFQIGVSLIATGFVYRLSRALGASIGTAFFIVFAHGTSQSLLYDQSILTDSLTASLLTIIACTLAIDGVAGRPPRILKAIGLGLLLSVALILREATLYLQVFLWPLIALWTIRPANLGWGRRLVVVLCLAAPFITTLKSYQAWNAYRTGQAFLTTGGQTALLTPLVRIQNSGIPLFDGDEPLDDAVRTVLQMMPDSETMTDMKRVKKVGGILVYKYGYDVQDIQSINKSRYLRSWVTHPLAMFHYSLKSFNFKQVIVQFWPTRYLDRIITYTSNERAFPTKKEVIASVRAGDVNPLDIFYVLLESLLRIPAVLIFIAFSILAPYKLIRALIAKQPLDNRWLTMSALWTFYWGVVAFYSLMSIELRYVLPVTPFATIVGVLALIELTDGARASWRARQRSAKSAT